MPPFTDRLFRQHLDYLRGKRVATPETLQPTLTSNDCANLPSNMASPKAALAGEKRKADHCDHEEPNGKRARTAAIHNEDAIEFQKLVPVISRHETNAQVELQQSQPAASPSALEGDSDDDNFVDASEDVAGYYTQTSSAQNGSAIVPSNLTETAFESNTLSAWRPVELELPSTVIPDAVDDGLAGVNLFPELVGDDYNPFEGDDDQVSESEYGQEVIDDGADIKKPLDGSDMTALATQAQDSSDASGEHQDGQGQSFDDDEPDLDAFIAEANGTQPYYAPDQDNSDAEKANAKAKYQAPLPTHVEDANGVHKLMNHNGQVDAFIVEMGASSDKDELSSFQQSDFDLSNNDSGSQPCNAGPGQSTNSSQFLGPDSNSIVDPGVFHPELEYVGSDDTALVQSYEAQGYTYQPPNTRIATPPPPITAASTLPSQATILLHDGSTYNVSKTNATTTLQRAQDLSYQNRTTGPTLPRDFHRNLEHYYHFHIRALQALSNLSVPPLPSHRYWIAVLYPSKNPKSVKSEKDFMWMKGSRYSTISTVWHNFSLRTMEEDFVLTCRGEVLKMEDCVSEVDWFDDKVVVLRAVKREKLLGAGAKAGGAYSEKGLFWEIGVVPENEVEVVSLLDD